MYRHQHGTRRLRPGTRTTIGESSQSAMLCTERVESRKLVSRRERGDGEADEEVVEHRQFHKKATVTLKETVAFDLKFLILRSCTHGTTKTDIVV